MVLEDFIPLEGQRRIAEAITVAERCTSGEICVHVTPHCRGDVMRRAERVFNGLGLYATRHRNAVLIFVAYDDRRLAIFIVISKKNLNLRVYSRDSVLLAQYPACLSKNKGDKQRKGDMKTPESPAGKPFKITAIQDASTWKHDFKDGRGNILAYGHWFLRLETPGHSGIGYLHMKTALHDLRQLAT